MANKGVLTKDKKKNRNLYSLLGNSGTPKTAIRVNKGAIDIEKHPLLGFGLGDIEYIKNNIFSVSPYISDYCKSLASESEKYHKNDNKIQKSNSENENQSSRVLGVHNPELRKRQSELIKGLLISKNIHSSGSGWVTLNILKTIFFQSHHTFLIIVRAWLPSQRSTTKTIIRSKKATLKMKIRVPEF